MPTLFPLMFHLTETILQSDSFDQGKLEDTMYIINSPLGVFIVFYY